jgi:zinc transporter, ZIP family
MDAPSASAVWLAFGLTAFAGLSTGFGSALVLFGRPANPRFISGALGFSTGVMLYVSFVEILAKGRESLVGEFGETAGAWLAVAAFFAGIAVIALIDRMVPEAGNPHEPHKVEEISEPVRRSALLRMGLFTALAIGIHNFPEGLATFAATLADPAIGISIAVAIAIHNIPEGIAVAVPIHAATGSRRKAFWLSFSSGLAEPVGALLGWFLLRPFFGPTTFGLLFAAVAGVMVFVSLDELLPTAKAYDGGHTAIYGLIAGMAVMALSLLLI